MIDFFSLHTYLRTYRPSGPRPLEKDTTVDPEWTEEAWQTLFADLYRRTAADAEFRMRCLTDAHAAIEELIGRKLPEGTRIRFVEADLSDLERGGPVSDLRRWKLG
jgi:hypothetical protein